MAWGTESGRTLDLLHAAAKWDWLKRNGTLAWTCFATHLRHESFEPGDGSLAVADAS